MRLGYGEGRLLEAGSRKAEELVGGSAEGLGEHVEHALGLLDLRLRLLGRPLRRCLPARPRCGDLPLAVSGLRLGELAVCIGERLLRGGDPASELAVFRSPRTAVELLHARR